MRLAPDGEIQFRGRTVFKGYWNAPEATAAAFTEDGWYKTGDIGHFDDEGRLILSGRMKDIIVLPNGFNVYPEDIENALRDRRHPRLGRARDEARADRGDRPRGARSSETPARRDLRATIDAAVKAANATLGAEPADRRLAPLARGGLPAHAHAQGQARARSVPGSPRDTRPARSPDRPQLGTG